MTLHARYEGVGLYTRCDHDGQLITIKQDKRLISDMNYCVVQFNTSTLYDERSTFMTNDELRRTLRQQRLSGTTDSPNTFRWDTIHWACDTLNDRALVYELAIWLVQGKDCVIFGNRGCGKSYLAQDIGRTANEAGASVCYREASRLLRDIASATASGEDTKVLTTELLTVPLLIVDDLDVSNLPRIHAEHFIDLILRRYTKTSTIIILRSSLAELSKSHEDTPVKNALIDRLLHRRNVIEIRSKGD